MDFYYNFDACTADSEMYEDYLERYDDLQAKCEARRKLKTARLPAPTVTVQVLPVTTTTNETASLPKPIKMEVGTTTTTPAPSKKSPEQRWEAMFAKYAEETEEKERNVAAAASARASKPSTRTVSPNPASPKVDATETVDQVKEISIETADMDGINERIKKVVDATHEKEAVAEQNHATKQKEVTEEKESLEQAEVTKTVKDPSIENANLEITKDTTEKEVVAVVTLSLTEGSSEVQEKIEETIESAADTASVIVKDEKVLEVVTPSGQNSGTVTPTRAKTPEQLWNEMLEPHINKATQAVIKNRSPKASPKKDSPQVTPTKAASPKAASRKVELCAEVAKSVEQEKSSEQNDATDLTKIEGKEETGDMEVDPVIEEAQKIEVVVDEVDGLKGESKVFVTEVVAPTIKEVEKIKIIVKEVEEIKVVVKEVEQIKFIINEVEISRGVLRAMKMLEECSRDELMQFNMLFSHLIESRFTSV